MKHLDTIKQEIEISKNSTGVKELRIETVNLLFLDISSVCTGYSIFKVNFTTKESELTKAGCLWLGSDWEYGQKYDYMYGVIQNYFWVAESVDYIIVEQYSVNPKKMMGINVVSEMQGAIKAAAWSNGLKVDSIPPQSWRAQLQIKPIITETKKDYKTPTKTIVNTYVKVPDTVISNLTKKPRQTPSDVYDATAIGLAWSIKNRMKIIVKDCKFDDHVGICGQ
jgi:hypothetical protein